MRWLALAVKSGRKNWVNQSDNLYSAALKQ
jgi:hypothetical protein